MADTALYDLLGVPPGADARALKDAFRRLARLHHPDLNPGDATASERFIAISAAFEILQDSAKRALYDEFGQEGLQEGFDPIVERLRRRAAKRAASSFYDDTPFESVFQEAVHERSPFQTDHFNHDASAYARGADRTHTLEVTLDLAVTGGAASFAMGEQALALRIPAGVEDGEQVVVPGAGHPSPHAKGEPGDLRVTVRILPHAHLSRDGLDLSLRLPVTIPEALLGAKIQLPTPHGECTMTLPEGVHSGARLRLRQMGIKREARQGDLYVVIEVRAPDHLTRAVREAAEALKVGYTTDVRRDLKRP